MSETLLALYKAIVSGDDVEAKHLMELIDNEFAIYNRIIDRSKGACFKLAEVLCKEITRLERENKKLKKEIERLKK